MRFQKDLERGIMVDHAKRQADYTKKARVKRAKRKDNLRSIKDKERPQHRKDNPKKESTEVVVAKSPARRQELRQRVESKRGVRAQKQCLANQETKKAQEAADRERREVELLRRAHLLVPHLLNVKKGLIFSEMIVANGEVVIYILEPSFSKRTIAFRKVEDKLQEAFERLKLGRLDMAFKVHLVPAFTTKTGNA